MTTEGTTDEMLDALPLIFIAFALFGLVMTIVVVSRSMHERTNWSAREGVVVGTTSSRTGHGEQPVTYRRIEWTDDHGVRRTFTETLGRTRMFDPTGRPVKIYVDPSDPARASTASLGSVVVFVAFVVIGGLGAVVATIVM